MTRNLHTANFTAAGIDVRGVANAVSSRGMQRAGSGAVIFGGFAAT